MTDHIIKNEQWYVKDLISKIDNNLIKKPQYQRKRKFKQLEESLVEFLVV